MEFSRQENWSGLPYLPPGDLPHLGIEPGSPTFQANSLPLSYQAKDKCRHVFNNLLQMFFLPSLAFNGISTEGGKSLAWALQQNASLRIFW